MCCSRWAGRLFKQPNHETRGLSSDSKMLPCWPSIISQHCGALNVSCEISTNTTCSSAWKDKQRCARRRPMSCWINQFPDINWGACTELGCNKSGRKDGTIIGNDLQSVRMPIFENKQICTWSTNLCYKCLFYCNTNQSFQMSNVDKSDLILNGLMLKQ